jgi:hypothetical protein
MLSVLVVGAHRTGTPTADLSRKEGCVRSRLRLLKTVLVGVAMRRRRWSCMGRVSLASKQQGGTRPELDHKSADLTMVSVHPSPAPSYSTQYDKANNRNVLRLQSSFRGTNLQVEERMASNRHCDIPLRIVVYNSQIRGRKCCETVTHVLRCRSLHRRRS